MKPKTNKSLRPEAKKKDHPKPRATPSNLAGLGAKTSNVELSLSEDLGGSRFTARVGAHDLPWRGGPIELPIGAVVTVWSGKRLVGAARVPEGSQRLVINAASTVEWLLELYRVTLTPGAQAEFTELLRERIAAGANVNDLFAESDVVAWIADHRIAEERPSVVSVVPDLRAPSTEPTFPAEKGWHPLLSIPSVFEM